MSSAFSQITITDLSDLTIKEEKKEYCRATIGSGSGSDLNSQNMDMTLENSVDGWLTDIIPETTSEYPYIWLRVTTIYESDEDDSPSSIVYSVFTTKDSITIGGRNLIHYSKNMKNHSLWTWTILDTDKILVINLDEQMQTYDILRNKGDILIYSNWKG